MAGVVWSPSSIEDLEAIAEFISRDSPHYAGLLVQRIMKRVDLSGSDRYRARWR
jgi:plasmid stabilization system protein ParE